MVLFKSTTIWISCRISDLGTKLTSMGHLSLRASACLERVLEHILPLASFKEGGGFSMVFAWLECSLPCKGKIHVHSFAHFYIWHHTSLVYVAGRLLTRRCKVPYSSVRKIDRKKNGSFLSMFSFKQTFSLNF